MHHQKCTSRNAGILYLKISEKTKNAETCDLRFLYNVQIKVKKIKLSHYRPGEALGVPGG